MISVVSMLACAFDEKVPEVDIQGVLRIPVEAASRYPVTLGDDDVTLEVGELTADVRFIGAVYLGAYSGIDTISFDYPHPAMGPSIDGQLGDTYPYGGTTVGRFDFACYQAVACRVVTGRFTSFGDVIDYFANSLGKPIENVLGEEVVTEDAYREECYDYFEITTDAELAFIGEPQFVRDGDYFVADFKMPHTLGVDGAWIWGFMDAPEIDRLQTDSNGTFTTCNPSVGRNRTDYNETTIEGRTEYEVLNEPSRYISPGDWVTGSPVKLTFDEEGNPDPVFIDMNFPYSVEVD
jgi:hypothetical protein